MSRLSRGLAAAGAVLAVAVALAACSTTPPADDEERSIAIGLPGFQVPATWDPAGGGFGLYFMANRPVYESLLKWDLDEGELVGGLAESFEFSEDGLTVSMKLRENVDFVDGEHLDADAAVKALTDAYTREGSYWSRPGITAETVVTATGEYTLDVTYPAPVYDVNSLALEGLYYLPIASPKALDDPTVFEDGPVGTGPYILDEYVSEVSATYVRNPEYRDPEEFDFDTIVLKVYDDRVAALNALKSGQLNAAEMDPSFAAEAESSGLVVHTGLLGFVTIDFGRTVYADTPATQALETENVLVRQAINLAFDREAILEQIVGGYGRVSSQPLDPFTPEYVEGGDDRYPYDPEGARELLAEAGYANGFVIRLPITPQSENQTGRYRPIVEQSLADIGITVEWVTMDGAELAAALLDGTLHADFWQDIYPNVVRESADWIEANPGVVDAELVDAAEGYNSGTVAEHIAAQPVLAEFVLDQATRAPIAHVDQLWVTTADVEMRLTNLPTYFVTLDSFQAAE